MPTTTAGTTPVFSGRRACALTASAIVPNTAYETIHGNHFIPSGKENSFLGAGSLSL